MRITTQPSLYFWDDFPCPLPFDFLKGGISWDKISPCIIFAGDDLDTLLECLFLDSFLKSS